ncbi:BT0820 family HAD-type phosphatase [Tenuifilum thalassicum]|uniref:Hydrolase n=1 Tax=Tenuifilum thalassicum TaxID=2590900 RepID=A0A7D4BCM0_9BACT|nr:hydrolase [Tenuifilum thalassicum]QKG78863.1 hydrolase [Tenuifilum thalassicum]
MLRVAVDFDGTIVENEYPAMGKPLLFAFETLKELQKRGFVLILWTVRTGKLLDEAVELCKQNGVEFYAINSNHPEEVFDTDTPRKLDVDVFIDDRNLGGFPGWDKVFQTLCPNEPVQIAQKKVLSRYKRKGFIRRLLGI